MGNFRQNSHGGFRNDRRSGDRGPRGFSRNSGNRFSRDGERDSRGFEGERRERSFEKYEVICDKCGKKTDVPFKPTQGKPVLCRECFDAAKPVSIAADKIDKINEKLDKIMQAMKIT